MELDAISQPELERLKQIGTADLLVGIFDLERQEDGGAVVKTTRDALEALSKPLRTLVVYNDGINRVVAAEPSENGVHPAVASYSVVLSQAADTPQQSISNVYQRMFAVGGTLEAQACGVIASGLQTGASEWIYRLVQPVLELGFDLVAPCYSRGKMEGLLNKSILSPLHRALYGQRLENPMGPDFGVSGRFLRHILGQKPLDNRGSDRNTLASITSAAATGNFQVCESFLGTRAQLSTDWANLSELLADVLGAAFLDVEGRAAYWQSLRASKAVDRFGLAQSPPPDTGPVAVGAMLESFRLGIENLRDVWRLVLPPTTLLELKRLSRLPDDQFRLPDPVWVRIVYDFALGHRLRTISRDHLLRSITPLYLGWIASYALEMQNAGPADIDARVELLSKVYEDNKPYFVSRWRWPDPFNP